MPGNSPLRGADLTSGDIAAERDMLIATAREAGRLALTMKQQGVKTLNKKDGSPVTDADLAVNELLETALRAQRPGYAWLSEESPAPERRADQTRTFIVDPIDGTGEFLQGTARWCVALALLHHDALIASVIFNPVTDEVFAAGLGLGAQCNGEALRVSSRLELAACRMLSPKIYDWTGWPSSWPEMSVTTGGACGSRMADVASGRADAYVSITEKWDWDTAPGALLITEAGGAVTDTQGARFSYNSASSRQLSVAAAPPALHAQIIARTRRISLPLKLLDNNSRAQLEPED